MRIHRENVNTSFFHIMVQGINKEYIFDSKEDKCKYINIMKETKEKIDTMILAYCIMHNHAHILFYEQNPEVVTQYMHRLNLIYAKYYNKKYDRVGYVFRDRYKLQPIYSEEHLHTCVRYIHNNPVKAHICQNASEYKYSSLYNNIFYTDTELERSIKQNMYICENNEINCGYKNEFRLIENDENKENIAREILEEIIIEHGITKKEFYDRKELIAIVVKKLKNEIGISYRMMGNILGIDRRKLKKIEEMQNNI